MPLSPEQALSGLTALQALLCFRLFSKDPKPLKSIVVLSGVGSVGGMWFYVVKNFGDESKIGVINHCVPGVGMTTATVTTITHCFHVHRIFRLSNRKYWPAAPILVVTLLRMLAHSLLPPLCFESRPFHFSCSTSPGLSQSLSVCRCSYHNN
ncbi:hypothetical protein JOM56_004534 [Amanita muscaria]